MSQSVRTDLCIPPDTLLSNGIVEVERYARFSHKATRPRSGRILDYAVMKSDKLSKRAQSFQLRNSAVATLFSFARFGPSAVRLYNSFNVIEVRDDK